MVGITQRQSLLRQSGFVSLKYPLEGEHGVLAVSLSPPSGREQWGDKWPGQHRAGTVCIPNFSGVEGVCDFLHRTQTGQVWCNWGCEWALGVQRVPNVT